MNNVSIKGMNPTVNLDKEIKLSNGSIIVVKEGDFVYGIYLVISFRDNKGRYEGQGTGGYCSLINLDSGQFAFEERCSRKTMGRRVLNHILRLGYEMPYDPNSKKNDKILIAYDAEVYPVGEYKIEIDLNKE